MLTGDAARLLYEAADMLENHGHNGTAEDLRDMAPELAQPPATDHYTCIGKGGEYKRLGPATPAGTLSHCDLGPLVAYRDVATSQIYLRFADDFDNRMEALK